MTSFRPHLVILDIMLPDLDGFEVQRRLADRLELAAVNAAVRRGWSWTEVAAALGVTRQAAHKKFARRVERPDA